jgi:hypothetical protein
MRRLGCPRRPLVHGDGADDYRARRPAAQLLACVCRVADGEYVVSELTPDVLIPGYSGQAERVVAAALRRGRKSSDADPEEAYPSQR